MRYLFSIILTQLIAFHLTAQSIEIMGGHGNIFVDAQWLKPLKEDYSLSIFSRSTGTLNYDGSSSLFLGVYGNYTSKIGLGATMTGRVSSNATALSTGIHFLKNKKSWMLFCLPTIGINTEAQMEYIWFSIFRFRPKITSNWRLYTSLELVFLFQNTGHMYSTERIRLGLDSKGWQFGIAANLEALGDSWMFRNNIGGFIRKEF